MTKPLPTYPSRPSCYSRTPCLSTQGKLDPLFVTLHETDIFMRVKSNSFLCSFRGSTDMVKHVAQSENSPSTSLCEVLIFLGGSVAGMGLIGMRSTALCACGLPAEEGGSSVHVACLQRREEGGSSARRPLRLFWVSFVSCWNVD